jgi:hypothetical protein
MVCMLVLRVVLVCMGRRCDRDRCRVRWGEISGVNLLLRGEGELRPASTNYSNSGLEARVR